MSETVRVSEVDGVGWITLNRPEAMNAITVELGAALEQALAELADRARVVVIRGAGGNFCVGGDFKELQELRSRGEGAMRELFVNFGRACASIARLRIPVVAKPVPLWALNPFACSNWVVISATSSCSVNSFAPTTMA